MKTVPHCLLILLGCLVALPGAVSRAADADLGITLRARLTGLEEVPPIFTPRQRHVSRHAQR
jgi:hypothetical protein